ncbi:NAD(P)-binding protein [Auriculariales sp. MPI-PUGE-AT-0066]|nr:NAD(P)-binding protein [Auriculariales sp. MPI-PUGE-AT-0066]
MTTFDDLVRRLESHGRGAQVAYALATIGAITFALAWRRPSRPARYKLVPPAGERVLVVGASSGVGKEVARMYASRGARVCLTGRRFDELQTARAECAQLGAADARAIRMDAADAGDLLHVRDELEKHWGGVDTVVISAGVSALQPLLAVAGLNHDIQTNGWKPAPEMTRKGIEHTQEVVLRAVRGNLLGPMSTLLTFLPMLSTTSKRPVVLLVGSTASLIPAPTRTVYAATKSASLSLFRGLSIEHPEVKFCSVLPGTIEGNFRSSAVDGGAVRESLETALTRESVASAVVRAVDNEIRTTVLPTEHLLAFILTFIWPSYVDRIAGKKYNFGH